MAKSIFTPSKQTALFVGIGLSILLLIADFFAGPIIQFPITYLIPVSLISWYNGKRWGLFLSIVMPLIRLFFHFMLWQAPWTFVESSVNALIRIIVISIFAVLIDRMATQSRILTRHVDLLEGLLPICSYCKKIRDKDDKWQFLEVYIAERSQATFSHGICPDCMKEHYGHLVKTST
jgi:K+-sensing histidine kinase KdpD